MSMHDVSLPENDELMTFCSVVRRIFRQHLDEVLSDNSRLTILICNMKFRVNISVRIFQGALNVQISVDTADSGVDSPVHSEKELFEVWERT